MQLTPHSMEEVIENELTADEQNSFTIREFSTKNLLQHAVKCTRITENQLNQSIVYVESLSATILPKSVFSNMVALK